MKKHLMWFLLLFIITNCAFAQQSKRYFNQTPPSNKASIFAPGIVSTSLNERDLAVSPNFNEIFWSIQSQNGTKSVIVYSTFYDGCWGEPEIAPFVKSIDCMYIEPAFSNDENLIYFVTNFYDTSASRKNTDIYYAQKVDGSWSNPTPLPKCINTKEPEFFPSFTNRNDIYFTRNNSDGTSSIYKSKFRNGNYQEAVLLPKEINCGKNRYNAFVAKDESFVIVPTYGMPDSYGATDYYITFSHENNKWSTPINLGAKINSSNYKEWSASVSPDGKYIFFMSGRENFSNNSNPSIISLKYLKSRYLNYGNGNSDIYWISSNIIKELQPLTKE